MGSPFPFYLLPILEPVASTFFITAGMFGVMSMYGYTTQQDLSSWGNLLFMALIGLILANII